MLLDDGVEITDDVGNSSAFMFCKLATNPRQTPEEVIDSRSHQLGFR